jgi:hypothetical protein
MPLWVQILESHSTKAFPPLRILYALRDLAFGVPDPDFIETLKSLA